MKTSKHAFTFRLFTVIIALTMACAPMAHAKEKDTDHPMLSGMPGYRISEKSHKAFGTLPDAGLMYCAPSRRCNASDTGFSAEGKLIAEGEVTGIR